MASLPFTLEKGVEHDFGMTNDELPAAVLEDLMAPNLAFELDEFTEIIPGVHWRTSSGGYILAFWVARLMRHSFFLFSYSPEGEWTDDAEIAGFFYEQGQIINRVANIGEPEAFYIVEAVLPDDSGLIDASSTSKWLIEVDARGKFIQSEVSEME